MSTEPLALQTPPEPGAPTQTTPPPAPEAGGSASGTSPPAPTAAGAPPTATPAPAAPQEWRDKVAGDDKAFLKTLERYTDEASFGKAHRALQQKVSSGELKEAPKPFPDKGTDQEKAAWREANGVPDKAESYVEKMAPPKGVVFGDTDKPGLERLADFASKANWSQGQYDAVLAAYHHELQSVTSAREAADDQFHQQAEDALRIDWGNDFRRNVNAVHNMLAGAPQGVRERLMGGRTADGKVVGDDPAVLKWLAQISLDLNPAATILPAGTSAEGHKSRLDTLTAMARNAESEYHKGMPDQQKALRAEYHTLLERQEALAGRGRAA